MASCHKQCHLVTGYQVFHLLLYQLDGWLQHVERFHVVLVKAQFTLTRSNDESDLFTARKVKVYSVVRSKNCLFDTPLRFIPPILDKPNLVTLGGDHANMTRLYSSQLYSQEHMAILSDASG